MTLFNPYKFADENSPYKFYLESPFQSDVRTFVDQMYSDIEPYIGDPNFKDMIQTDFHGTVWQLYSTWAFLKRGRSSLKKASAHGPDIVLEDGTIIEAVLANRGTGPDKPFAWSDVKPISDKDGIKIYPVRSMPYPDPQIILRITNAIKVKLDQRDRWIADGIVTSSQPFVVAVNAGLLDEAKDAYGGSYAARTAFALGNDVLVVPYDDEKGTGNIDKSYSKIEHKPAVEKSSGSPVKSDLFLNAQYSHLSGILFSPFHIGNVVQLGHFNDLEFVSNGFSTNPLPKELLKDVRYTWAEIDQDKNEYQVFSEPKLKK